MTEIRISPRTARSLVALVSVFPLVLGASLVIYTPQARFNELAYWLGLLAWTGIGILLTQREIAAQRPEAVELRDPRRPFLAAHHYIRAGLFVAILLLVFAAARVATFMWGISGFLLAQGAGYTYELGYRERLHYCEHCKGHRAFIRWQGQTVCCICGLPWSGEERKWQKPFERPGNRRAKHAFAEFFFIGPFLILVGIFGLQVLPTVGLSEWIPIPLLLMFGGLCDTIVLYRRFARKIQTNLAQTHE